MSMLAEPKRRQKWSVDPRNSAWSKDESKFGQKMLERMGWSKGKGLGRSEQGSTDHVKVKVKNNNYGLGTSVSHEDNWIAHQDDFNDLLAQLNNCHGQNSSSSTEPPPEEKKGFSLEEKSKTSKKRVHYMKFTKGKDLSSRTETDLNCIFGKRGRSAKEPEQEKNGSDSPVETEESSTPVTFELDTESITKTVTSTLTMQEYFAQRMAKLKKARGQDPSAEPSGESLAPSEEPSPICSANEDSEEPKKKKKKRKKSKKSRDEPEIAVENSNSPIVIESNDDEQPETPGKNKRKMDENEGAGCEDCSSDSVVELDCEEPPKKKKKKKKKLNKQNQETEQINGHGPTEDQTVEPEVVLKKKKKRREQMDNEVEEVKEEQLETKPKKDKKKKRKHQE